jgi:hypothetical protein
LGGAFAAFADDATAAFANPAGLVQITRPEVSFELRGHADASSFTDVGAGGLAQTSTNSASGVGFLSFVYPRGNWRFAFYRHQFAEFESLTEFRGLFGESVFQPLTAVTSAELGVVTYAVSGAYRLKDNLSIGLGASHFSGDLMSRTEFVSFQDEITRTEILRVDDSDWGMNAGVVWSITKNVNVGGFYRQSPSFSAAKETLGDPELEFNKVRLPDVFGAGIAFRSNSGRIAASVEWDHVRYSLTGDEDTEVDDGDEIHLGFEYVFLGITPIIGLRTGVWHDPGLRVHLVPDGSASRATSEEPGRWHYAFGLGFAFRRFQLDFGFDVSGLVLTGSFSGIINF